MWRGTRDGFDSAAFHRLCDGKDKTLTVVKNTEGFIFGGFTAVPWSSVKGYKTDDTAFIFSLTNPSGSTLKLKATQPEQAVYHHPSWGPVFGGGDSDLYVCNSSNTNRRSYMNLQSYELPNALSGKEGRKFIVGAADRNFQTVEIEIYQCL